MTDARQAGNQETTPITQETTQAPREQASAIEWTPKFSFIPIDPKLVIYTTQHTFAFLSIQPILPFHTLVVPKRVVQYFSELTKTEVEDFAETVQFISKRLRLSGKGSSVLHNIQDGPQAGQVIKHVHMHLLARNEGDWKANEARLFQGGKFDEVSFNIKGESEWPNADQDVLKRDSEEMFKLLNGPFQE